MSTEVYANMMGIACKAADGKTVAAMPDVCLSPPTPPAGPVPIPYPNTAMASDTTDGSKTVQINGEEVMLKDKSTFKQSNGDEAATKSLGMGVVTHQIQGEVSFTSWSMDVKFEGENVPRHLDLTMHNEMSMPGNCPPWPYLANMSPGDLAKCQADKDKEEAACGHDKATNTYTKSPDEACADRDCQQARKCMLVPYKTGSKSNCCPGLTPHHMIEDHWVSGNNTFPMAQGTSGYNAAPTVCAQGSRFDGQHGIMHGIQGVHEDSFLPGGVNAGKKFNYERGKKATLRAHQLAFDGECKSGCLGAQLDAFYGKDTNPSRDLNQPTEHQSIAQTGEDRLVRSQAEGIVDQVFGGARL